MPVIGFLNGTSQQPTVNSVAAFRQGLSETGYVEAQNVVIEYRWAEGRYDQLPALAADLVRRQVAVIVAGGGTISPQVAKAATATIPIVFLVGSDPVEIGLVASLSRPGGNVTGVSLIGTELGGKKFGLLRDLVPNAAAIAVLLNPTNPNAELERKDVETAARAIGQQIQIFDVRNERDIDLAFATMVENRADAFLIGSDAYLVTRRNQIVALAARHAIPAVYPYREFAEAGGVLTYGANRADSWRQVGVYTGKILKGAKPADLPVLQPTKFELVINLKTAKTLGLTIPAGVLAIADEVIE
jgi:putative ABC transport system substrate-binding protein